MKGIVFIGEGNFIHGGQKVTSKKFNGGLRKGTSDLMGAKMKCPPELLSPQFFANRM
jgi:hypothetical protein